MPSIKDKHVTISVNGIAELEKDYINAAILTAALHGAAERWLFGEEVYKFCPHTDCPNYHGYLCQTYFYPPLLNAGYKECGFNSLIHRRTGYYPNELWSRKNEW